MNLDRRQIRYWCFRFQTELAGGVEAADAPKGLKETIEQTEGFRGWDEFAVSWDVDEDDPYTIVPRNFSVWEDWDRTLIRVTEVIHGEG